MRITCFEKNYPIRFSHCDPAGIVYFPQYLVLSNWLVEDWFTEGLGIDFSHFICARRLGLPIVKLENEFLAPSRQGELLTFRLELQNLGRRSLEVLISARFGDQVRMQSKQVMVITSLESGKSIVFPDDVRQQLQRFTEQTKLTEMVAS
ncbi:acyl-CoA thioesterase [Solimicrobium silvestre]|uniref:Thioesterase superfamily n=1 Tax=Solimicrobium silvestre TaxID=2099400 RepID=A0A2S9H2S1_9BURK|nr:thioesterase family protein [Solimicrobium silvestre]PRC94285.1 Thioesterase superfamily [Solimicrobium silvestre]